MQPHCHRAELNWLTAFQQAHWQCLNHTVLIPGPMLGLGGACRALTHNNDFMCFSVQNVRNNTRSVSAQQHSTFIAQKSRWPRGNCMTVAIWKCQGCGDSTEERCWAESAKPDAVSPSLPWRSSLWSLQRYFCFLVRVRTREINLQGEKTVFAPSWSFI